MYAAEKSNGESPLEFFRRIDTSRVKTLLEWFPLVFVDLHEMGSDSTYYFAPEAVPYNPHLTKDQKSSLEWFGKNNAKWFDLNGFSYFTREVYDAFYPGYGASWPAYYGAIAMTYEQASSRGLLMRRSDETVFHFRDTVRQHFVASISDARNPPSRSAQNMIIGAKGNSGRPVKNLTLVPMVSRSEEKAQSATMALMRGFCAAN